MNSTIVVCSLAYVDVIDVLAVSVVVVGVQVIGVARRSNCSRCSSYIRTLVASGGHYSKGGSLEPTVSPRTSCVNILTLYLTTYGSHIAILYTCYVIVQTLKVE
jgi:hypothetical protein